MESCGVPVEIDRVLDALRRLDGLGPADIARLLPELEHARVRLWVSMLMPRQGPMMMLSEPKPEVFTVKEVADQLRFSPGHVYEMVRSGRLRGIRDGRAIRISRDALAEWQNAREADQLDGGLRHSAESQVHGEPSADAARRHRRPDPAPARPGRQPMTRSG